MRRVFAVTLVLLLGACQPDGPRILPITHTVKLSNTNEGSEFCADPHLGDYWSTRSSADLSRTRTPSDEGVGGVCMIPISREHEAFVLESANCARSRGTDETRAWLAVDHGQYELILTEQSPMVHMGFGRGLVNRRDIKLTLLGSDHAIECTVQGYYVYPEEPAAEGEAASVHPWHPQPRLIDERPGAPK